MSELSVVILAAGMGSRFGGLKQMQAVDNDGCFIIDYSVYDAIRAGASHIIFVIKKGIEAEFKATIGARAEKHVKTTYVYQEMTDLPKGFTVPENRIKPWGTAHAVMTARNAVSGPFAIINADDFYGYEAYKEMFEAIPGLPPANAVMAGYMLGNVLSETGGVSRGICGTDGGSRLLSVAEHYNVRRNEHGIAAQTQAGETIIYPPETYASVSFWGMSGDVMASFLNGFETFLNNLFTSGDPVSGEFQLPTFIQEEMDAGRLTTRVIPTKAEWSGVTHHADLEGLVTRIQKYKQQGMYPARLWSND